MIRQSMTVLLHSLLLWVALLAGAIVSSGLFPFDPKSIGNDGPLSSGQAFLLVNAIHAVVLASLARKLQGPPLLRGMIAAVALFGVQSFLLLLEAFYFLPYLNVSPGFLLNGAVHSAIQSLMVAVAIGLVARGSGTAQPASASHLPWPRLAGVSFGYVLVYFLAGYFIAWASPAVQHYYGMGEELALLPLLTFQLLRGALWAFLALVLVRSLRGSVAATAILIGITFSALAVAQLLYPSSIMPWPVRWQHMIEVGVSNFVFGAFAALLLHPRFVSTTKADERIGSALT